MRYQTRQSERGAPNAIGRVSAANRASADPAGTPPSILRVVQEYLPRVSGPANVIAGSSAALALLGWRTEIVTCDLGMGDEPLEHQDGIQVRRFHAAGPVLSSYFSPQLIRAVRDSRCDVIHVHGFRNLTSDASMLLSRRRCIVFQPHGMIAGYRHMMGPVRSIPYRLYDVLAGRQTVKPSAATLVSTRLEFEECVRWGIPAHKVTLIPEGVDDAFFAIPEHPEPQQPFQLLYVGRLSRDRNVETLIRALAHVRARGIDARLRIVGRAAESSVLNAPSSVSSLRALCRTTGVDSAVEITGELTGRDLLHEFQAATVFVYAARYDSFGQALAQAAAAGLAIVCTPVGVATEIIRHGESGWLAGPDGASFGSVLLRALEEPGRLNAVGRTARSAAARFRWSSVAGAYVTFYSELLGR